MNCLRMCCAVLVVGLAAQSLFGAAPKTQQNVAASVTLTDNAAQAIKAAFPAATIGAVKLNMDRGLQVYYVELSGDKTASCVEVTATAPVMVIQAGVGVEQKDLPAAIAKTLGTLDLQGAAFHSATKLDIRADFTPREFLKSSVNYKLLPLSPAVTAYDVMYSNKDGVNGVVRLDPDGKVIAPMNWMKRASAVVPPGKLVIRAHLGRIIDYTDRSGVVWSADRVYSKENGWGALGGRPGGRLNLTVLGTDAPFIYDGERDKEGAYRFDVPNGLYTVRMHFCESWDGARQPNVREFGIKIQGKKVVEKMDISGTAGGWLIPLVKEFKDVEVTDGKLLVEPFGNNGRDQHASVQAYEVYAQ